MSQFKFEFDSVTKEGKFTEDDKEVPVDYVSFGKTLDYEKGKMVWTMNTGSTEHDKENGVHKHLSTYASEFAVAALRKNEKLSRRKQVNENEDISK